MNRLMSLTVIGAVAGFVHAAPAPAQVLLSRSVIASGGGISAGAMRSSVTVGQPVIGTSEAPLMEVCHGFWCGGVLIHSGVVPAPLPSAGADLPTRFALGVPWPNPTRGQAQFELALPAASHVRLCLVDVTGRLAAVVHDGFMDAGRFRVQWDGHGTRGNTLPVGMYYARLEVNGRTRDRRAIVILK